jgi:hypothetical protein
MPPRATAQALSRHAARSRNSAATAGGAPELDDVDSETEIEVKAGGGSGGDLAPPPASSRTTAVIVGLQESGKFLLCLLGTGEGPREITVGASCLAAIRPDLVVKSDEVLASACDVPRFQPCAVKAPCRICKRLNALPPGAGFAH